MPRLAPYILLAGLGVGCHHGASSRHVVLPSGEKAFAVSCEQLDRCYELAGRDCPKGYHQVNGNEDEQEAKLQINSVGARARAGTNHTWVIQCN